ncbi:hypothetical protein Tco_1195218, partial [Tanacetum coccineum]
SDLEFAHFPFCVGLHVELRYHCFEEFKVLAYYLPDFTLNHMYCSEIILVIPEEIDTNLADVVENLMPKTSNGDPKGCLNSLISALKRVKLKKMDEEQGILNNTKDERLII